MTYFFIERRVCFGGGFVGIYKAFIVQPHRFQKLKNRSFAGRQDFFLFKYGCVNLVEKELFFACISPIKIYIDKEKIPILSSFDILCTIKSKSRREGSSFIFLILPKGRGFLMALPYWLLSSILSIFVTTLVLLQVFDLINEFLVFFRQQNFRVEGKPRIYAAESTDKYSHKYVHNIGLCWECDDCLG